MTSHSPLSIFFFLFNPLLSYIACIKGPADLVSNLSLGGLEPKEVLKVQARDLQLLRPMDLKPSYPRPITWDTLDILQIQI